MDSTMKKLFRAPKLNLLEELTPCGRGLLAPLGVGGTGAAPMVRSFAALWRGLGIPISSKPENCGATGIGIPISSTPENCDFFCRHTHTHKQ